MFGPYFMGKIICSIYQDIREKIVNSQGKCLENKGIYNIAINPFTSRWFFKSLTSGQIISEKNLQNRGYVQTSQLYIKIKNTIWSAIVCHNTIVQKL